MRNPANGRGADAMGAVRFNTEPIKLSDGWSARVLTENRAATQSLPGAARGLTPPPRRLPTVEEWRPVLTQLVSNPESMPGFRLLKYSRTGEVFRVRVPVRDGSVEVICKQSRAQSLGRGLAALFRRSRESRNFDRALELIRAGINTAVPLALIEQCRPRRRAWLLTEFVPDLVDLDQVALRLLPQLEPLSQRKVKDAILEAIVDLFECMERHNLAHRDLKTSNILLGNWDGRAGRVDVWLVDLDGLRRRRSLLRAVGFSPRGRASPALPGPCGLRPAARLAAGLLSCTAVTRSDYCRFLQAYLARRGLSRRVWKHHFRKLTPQVSDFLRRARQGNAHKADGYTGD